MPDDIDKIVSALTANQTYVLSTLRRGPRVEEAPIRAPRWSGHASVVRERRGLTTYVELEYASGMRRTVYDLTDLGKQVAERLAERNARRTGR